MWFGVAGAWFVLVLLGFIVWWFGRLCVVVVNVYALLLV